MEPVTTLPDHCHAFVCRWSLLFWRRLSKVGPLSDLFFSIPMRIWRRTKSYARDQNYIPTKFHEWRSSGAVEEFKHVSKWRTTDGWTEGGAPDDSGALKHDLIICSVQPASHDDGDKCDDNTKTSSIIYAYIPYRVNSKPLAPVFIIIRLEYTSVIPHGVLYAYRQNVYLSLRMQFSNFLNTDNVTVHKVYKSR